MLYLLLINERGEKKKGRDFGRKYGFFAKAGRRQEGYFLPLALLIFPNKRDTNEPHFLPVPSAGREPPPAALPLALVADIVQLVVVGCGTGLPSQVADQAAEDDLPLQGM